MIVAQQRTLHFGPAVGTSPKLAVGVSEQETLGAEIRLALTLGPRDWSGDWDDRHDATIRFVVVAE